MFTSPDALIRASQCRGGRAIDSPLFIATIAAAADLGELIAEPIVIIGDWPWLRQSLAACAEVERAALRGGVSLAEPFALGLEVGDALVHVHRWWVSRPVGPGDDVTTCSAARWLSSTRFHRHQQAPPMR